MPTFEAQDRFWREYDDLDERQQQLFRAARNEFVRAVQAWEAAGRPGLPQFPARLGVTPMVGRRGILELAWAADGRCTWQFGAPQRPGKSHIIWRRIGSHAIYDDP